MLSKIIVNEYQIKREYAKNQCGCLNWAHARTHTTRICISASMHEWINQNQWVNDWVNKTDKWLCDPQQNWLQLSAYDMCVPGASILLTNHTIQFTLLIRLCRQNSVSAVACYSVPHCYTFGIEREILTISTVTSPTFVAPWLLRNALTFSCSAGIFSASVSFNVLSAEMLRTNVVKAGRVF